MLTQEEDQQLVERVQRGDKRAFDLLVLKYQHKILGLIVRFVHDTHEAQDVAQEAFIKAETFAEIARFIRGFTASPSTRRRIIWFHAAAGRRIAMSVPKMQSSTMAIMASRISSRQSVHCCGMRSKAPSIEPFSNCQKICVQL